MRGQRRAMPYLRGQSIGGRDEYQRCVLTLQIEKRENAVCNEVARCIAYSGRRRGHGVRRWTAWLARWGSCLDARRANSVVCQDTTEPVRR